MGSQKLYSGDLSHGYRGKTPGIISEFYFHNLPGIENDVKIFQRANFLVK